MLHLCLAALTVPRNARRYLTICTVATGIAEATQ